MWYEVKFGLIGFVVGTVAISATTFASNVSRSPSPVTAEAQAPVERLALLPTPKPVVVAKTVETKTVETKKVETAKAPVAAKPMSAWRRAYIAKHGHQPPVAAPIA
jgi:hypothetical protein